MAEFSSFYSSLYNSRGLTTPRLVETPIAPPNPCVESPVPYLQLESPPTQNPSVDAPLLIPLIDPPIPPAVCYRNLHNESVEAAPQQIFHPPYPVLPGYPGYSGPFLRPMSPIMKHPLFGYTPETNSQQVSYWPPSQKPFPTTDDPDIEVVYESIRSGHEPNCYNPSSLQKAPNLCSTKSQELQNRIVQNSSQKNVYFHCANTLCRRILSPGKFNVHPVTEEKVCNDCCWYYKRNGKDREVSLMRRKIDAKRRVEKLETNCSNTFCNLPLPLGKPATHPITKEKICVACNAYYEITGGTGDTVGAKVKKQNHQTEDLTNKLITVHTSEHVPIIEPIPNFEHSKQSSNSGAWTGALASASTLEKSTTENPGLSCQEECITPPSEQRQEEMQSHRTSETQEPQSETIQKGQKCANSFCRGTLFPRNIMYHPITKKKICKTCYAYYKRNGIDREVIITIGRKEQREIKCANTICKKPCYRTDLISHPATKEKICYGCYSYYKRNGRDREVIQTHTRRKDYETHCANTFCKRLLLPGRHVAHPVTKERICDNCCYYYKTYGHDRPW